METHKTLQARIKRLRFIGNEAPAKWAGAVAEHEAMVAALSRHDGDALAGEIGKPMDQTLTRVSEVIV